MPRDSDWNLKSRSCSLSRRAHASHGMPRSRHSALTRRRGRKLACSGPAGGAGSCAAVCQWTRIPSQVQVAFLPIKMRSKSALYSEAIMMLTVTHDSKLRESHKALSNLKLVLSPRESKSGATVSSVLQWRTPYRVVGIVILQEFLQHGSARRVVALRVDLWLIAACHGTHRCLHESL